MFAPKDSSSSWRRSCLRPSIDLSTAHPSFIIGAAALQYKNLAAIFELEVLRQTVIVLQHVIEKQASRHFDETAANAARLRVVQLGIAFVLPFLGVHFVNYCQPGCKVTPIYLDLTPE